MLLDYLREDINLKIVLTEKHIQELKKLIKKYEKGKEKEVFILLDDVALHQYLTKRYRGKNGTNGSSKNNI